MRRSSVLALGLLTAAAVTACGSTVQQAPRFSGGQSSAPAAPLLHGAPKDVLLASVQRARGTSFRASFDMGITMQAEGRGAAQMGALANGMDLNMSMQLSAENSRRMRASVGTSAAGRNVNVVSVEYDGSLYVSTDGGNTFKRVETTKPIAGQYGIDSVLQYLEAVGTVTDAGPSSDAAGNPVENYHAVLDPAKTTAMLQSAMGSMSPRTSLLMSAFHLSSGTLDVQIDPSGHPVSETVDIQGSMDLGAISPQAAGNTLTFSESGTGTFSDFGAAITVSPPADVTGTMTL